ncbi:hypothetical protein H8356DRAFT_1634830 [Neocallimastix lanati (nom. inval.)]|jgi:SNW domain-containing protein 1|uniref:Pre-mRNA-processing protein 45 n=1 Tax=Neocallimastix californiae TaxID=1754190 RepID=A0A1Y2EP76_9FUNG|nr:hypothetical protein H8356DRAFT_1634830 [Neocallimastix sp. JGI-2020a]ORY72655.1 hypothetical protein LY90DRAFT_660926 [Neocallimastix californiae]|eukprot:ORY72655.1 hypothetical protein LY90DRAFT_660926 [Neocallimastix californiae]
MSLASFLPKPRNQTLKNDSIFDRTPLISDDIVGPPPYRHRKGFIPRTVEDFGNGGAFPEIHVVQYPLDMGRKKSIKTSSTKTLPLQVDGDGKIRYDAILKQGHSNNRIIHSQLKDIVPMEKRDFNARPTEDEIKKTTEKTQAALQAILEGRSKSVQGGTSKDKKAGPSFVKYTPASKSTVGSRIIRMVEAPVDPMEPPKFKHKKMPRGPPSPPAPVLHSPPRKVSAEEQSNWVIPPCISNWKNAKGYTIPLDKRLAADGRGIQDIQINPKFASFSEALSIADRHAREEVRLRANMQAKLAAKEKKEKEERLRMLAQRAREERAGLINNASSEYNERKERNESESESESGSDTRSESSRSEHSHREHRSSRHRNESESERKAKERDNLRRERQKQREREMRLSHMGQETKSKVMRKLGDRDISEKIALGLAQPTASRESMYDQRLFNRSEGLSSGFGSEDSYNIYDKPLFAERSSNTIYRPKKTVSDENYDTEAIEKIVSNKIGGEGSRGFKGADVNSDRSGPVQFEKEEDPYELEKFLKNKRNHEGDDERSSEKRRRH